MSVLADSSSSYPFLSALWLMIVFFVVGSGAGFMNVVRVAKAYDKRQAEQKAAEAVRRKNEG